MNLSAFWVINECNGTRTNCVLFISDSLYNKMRKKLADRIHDKDTGVRVQAVVALSKFQVSAICQFWSCKIN